MDFERLAFEKKDELLKQVGKMYRYSELSLELNKGFCVKEDKNLYSCLEIKHRIDIALKQLCDYQVQIIRKEYIEDNRKNWYLQWYHDKEFRVCKERSMNALLHALYG
ncbi:MULTISPECIES: hypothetical protein [unclassified Breznakia]|uniref:hypothetical protein n=1 Tax=unclassified Breznakia TaxID=2623764 RepID=UPI0024059493|nr:MULTISPECIES: hypothetical protein [unclassified Breznakia]MDL2276401.1 hypothetical protein [Breznakia sp. OttesenSCG-928-G09]